jgi:hypothetical protein
MSRGQTTEEFRDAYYAAHPEYPEAWVYHGGSPDHPGWVSDAARLYGERYDLDAEALDDAAAGDGWEFHDRGYDEKIAQLARDAVERGIPRAGTT